MGHYVNDILHGETADRMPKFGYPRNMRGYPDISLLATRYIIAVHGGFFQGKLLTICFLLFNLYENIVK